MGSTPAVPQPLADLRRAARHAEQVRRQAEHSARLVSLPVKHPHACGIDVGDASHWICVGSTPDGSDCVRAFPAHTAGLQKLVDWLRQCSVTTVALEASGVYGHVLFLTLLEAGFQVVMTSPYPLKLAKLRDKRCKHGEEQIACALDGRYRPEYVLELRCCLAMWEKYQEVIAEVDQAIAQQLQAMRRQTALPALPAKPRVRGRKPHDPRFDVRTALYYVSGVDLTAIEGIDEIHALTLVSELGCDMTKWPSVKQFTSWLGLCPNFKKTGGKVKSSRTRKGKNRAATALRLAAWGLMRSRSYLGAYLRRQRGRLGAPKAITALAHKLARIVYHLMRYGEGYVKQTEEAYAEQVRQRVEKQLRRRAKEMGYELKKVEAKTAEAEK